jgi:hypothetical protein
MKLLFSKDAKNEISVKYQNGTIVEDFSYTAMIQSLMVESNFDGTDFGNLNSEEQEKLNQMMSKILDVFKTDSAAQPSTQV